MATQAVKETMSSMLPGGSKTQWDQADIPDLTGKVYIVTGGSLGIGYGIMSALMSKNPRKVLFLSSREVVAKEEIEALKVPLYGEDGEPVQSEEERAREIEEKVEWVKCDLNSLKEVDRVSLELRKKCENLGRLDGIVANAGIGIGKYQMSENGIESHFQINHLSHMHMILTLLPILRDTVKKYKSDVRVVLQSSENHRLNLPSHVKFESLDEINTDVGAAELYSRTKLAQVLFMHALIRRLEANQLPTHNCPLVGRSGIVINSTHPGIVWTDQMKQMEEAWGIAGKAVTALVQGIATDPIKKGCLSALYALTDKNLLTGMPRGGAVYGQYITPPNKVDEESSMAADEALQEKLWALSEDLLKMKLGKVGNM